MATKNVSLRYPIIYFPYNIPAYHTYQQVITVTLYGTIGGTFTQLSISILVAGILTTTLTPLHDIPQPIAQAALICPSPLAE